MKTTRLADFELIFDGRKYTPSRLKSLLHTYHIRYRNAVNPKTRDRNARRYKRLFIYLVDHGFGHILNGYEKPSKIEV